MGGPAPGRMTVTADDEVVVFLIGMRFNRPWRVWRWWPVFWGMVRMLSELRRHPEAGLVHAESWFGRTTVMVQYWRSLDHLLGFAHSPTFSHLAAWREFNRADRAGAVGVWHETYLTVPGKREAIYVDMPRFGLGAALGTVPVGGRTDSARQRLEGGR